MPVAPLSDDDVTRIAASYGLPVTSQDIASFRVLAGALLTSYDEVERRYAEGLTEPPSRAWERPADADNPLGAWYVTTRIQTRDDGPLAGLRIAVKDNIEVAGVPMMNGSAAVEGFIPRHDATVVTRLLDAGGVITGKAVCEDLCFSGGSHTSATGPVRNPWDNSRSAGGSSSGSAALVAAGHADLALGGDQGGSIRIPAAFCGVVGHKPTHGLVPYTGAFPIEVTLDQRAGHGGGRRRRGQRALAQRRHARLDGDRHRWGSHSDDRRGRLRHELGRPLRPRVDGTLSPRPQEACRPAAGDSQAHDLRGPARDGFARRPVLRHGPQPRARARCRLRPGARNSRRAGPADAANHRNADPGARRPARGEHRALVRDDRQHGAVRRDRASRYHGPGGPGRRPPRRTHDRRAAVRRRRVLAGRTGV